MCKFKSWYFDDNGYVLQCQTCSRYQVSYGTTMLTLNNNDFHNFTSIVFKTKENNPPVNNATIKCVVLPTPSSCVSSILTQYELDNLYYMLQEVDTEMKVEHLLGLFNPS